MTNLPDGWSSGLHDIEGTFSGRYDIGDDPIFGTPGSQPLTMYLYTDRRLPWWRRPFAWFADRYLGRPWPQDVTVLEQVVITTETTESPDGIVISGTFTRAGTMRIDE